MTVGWIIAAVLAAVMAGLAVYTFLVLRRLAAPTAGAPIDLAARPGRALIVIDVQEDFTRNTGKHAFDAAQRDAVLKRISADIAAARAAGDPVVFVRNVFRDWPVVLAMKLTAGGMGTPGREGLRIDRALAVGDAPVFEKAVGDSFSNPDLEAWLAEHKIGYLSLTGLDACHCVQLTAKGALARGFRVAVAEAATLTSRPQKWPSLKADLIARGALVTVA
jgi:biuret amidohydrolase